MATYTYDNPTASDKDRLRFEIQDTGVNDFWQYSDEELQFLINEYGLKKAKIEAIKGLMIRYAGLKDEKVDKVEVDYSQLYAQYKSLYDDLLRNAGRYGLPFAGGISKEDKRATARNKDNIGSSFKINDDDPEDLDNGYNNHFNDC